MTAPRTRAMVLALSALACVSLIQCGDDDVTAPDYGEAIDANILSLSHLDQGEPFAERPVGEPENAMYTLNGRTYECTEQQYEVAAEYDEQLILNPTSDVLWPGAIIDGNTIDTGEYVPIVVDRNPVTISVSLINIEGAKSRTVADPKLSTMREAISDILSSEVTGATEARVTFEVVDVHSESQLDLALGVSYNSGTVNVKNQFDFSRTDVLSRTIVKFLQVYYTIDVDVPQKPSECFAPAVSWASLDQQINGQVSPMYVSTIAYGRMALFTMESTYSSTQIHNALDASFAAIKTNTTLDVKHASVLQQSSMKATIIGGSGAQAVQVVNGFEGLRTYMTEGGNYDKDTAAAPLAYKLRYLCDNGSCRIVMAQNYVVRSCEELKPGHYGIQHNGWYVAWFYVDYYLDGVHHSDSSGNFTAGFTRSIDIPAKATNVFVLVREDTGIGYRTIFRYPASGGMPRPEEKCWKITGTTLSPKYEAITCYF